MARRVLLALVLLLTLPMVQNVHAASHLTRWQVLAAAARMPSFYDPSGITVGPRGSIFVADTGNNRILKLSPSGMLVSQWPVPLLPPDLHYFHVIPGQAYRGLPTVSLAVDPSGAVWVAAGQNLGLRKLSPSGRTIGHWGDTVTAVAADWHGNVYTIEGNEVQKRSDSGVITGRWPVPGPDGAVGGVPVGLAVAPDSAVYVDVGVEQDPDPSCIKGCYGGVAFSVEHLSPNGTLLGTWRAGTCSEFGNYCLWRNIPMAVQRGGGLIIADQDSDAVLTFSPTGAPTGRWGVRGHGAGQFEGILGLALMANGHVLVADAENGRLQVLSRTGQPLAQWGGGTAPGQFLCPSGVALAPNGTAYVRDIENNRVQELTPNGRVGGSWHVGPPGVVSQPEEYCGGYAAGIATNRQEIVYVAQPYDPGHLERYTTAGRPLGRIPLGSFRDASVAVGGNGNLFVAGADTFHRLLKLSPSGRVLAKWPQSPPPAEKAYGYTAVAVDPQGNVYLAAPFAGRIVKLSPALSVLHEWTGFAAPMSLATDPRGNVYVADNGINDAPGSTRRQAIWKLSPQGVRLAQWWSVGFEPGQIHDPQGVAVDPSGRWLYVADTGNNRVQRLWLGGQ